MARTLNPNQILAQQSEKRTPYFKLQFVSKNAMTTVDLSTDSLLYPNRILLIDHTEEPFNDHAYIMLRNNTRDLPNILGYSVTIGYGDKYGITNYYETSSRMWVKEQRIISSPGKLYTLLVLEGIWSLFGEQEILLGDPPYYNGQIVDASGNYVLDPSLIAITIYDIIGAIVGQVVTSTSYLLTLLALNPATDDDIIDNYAPGAEIISIAQRSHTALYLIVQLMGFTKSFIRVKNSYELEIKYPQLDDSADFTYYSYQQPYFIDFTSNDPAIVPNRILVFQGQDEYNNWPDAATVLANCGEATNYDAVDAYMEATAIHIAGYIDNQADADIRAEAILYKTEAQLVYGQLVIPHDAGVELYDLLSVVDHRGSSTTTTKRVGSIRHLYKPGSYTAEITLGGLAKGIDYPDTYKAINNKSERNPIPEPSKNDSDSNYGVSSSPIIKSSDVPRYDKWPPTKIKAQELQPNNLIIGNYLSNNQRTTNAIIESITNDNLKDLHSNSLIDKAKATAQIMAKTLWHYFFR